MHRGSQHLTGATGVPADDDGAGPALAGGARQPQCHFGCQVHIGDPAHTIGAKERLGAHPIPSASAGGEFSAS